MLLGGVKDIATLSAAARWLVKSALREKITSERLQRLQIDLHNLFIELDKVTRAVSPQLGHEYYPA